MGDDVTDIEDKPVTSAGPTLEQRVGRLEYEMSRISDGAKLSRSPVTNPIDDPDDPPGTGDGANYKPGTWDGHPWQGV